MHRLMCVGLDGDAEGAAQVQICDLEAEGVVIDQHILRLQVAVHHTVHVAVRCALDQLVHEALRCPRTLSGDRRSSGRAQADGSCTHHCEGIRGTVNHG